MAGDCLQDYFNSLTRPFAVCSGGKKLKGVVLPLKELTVRLEAVGLGAQAQEEVRSEWNSRHDKCAAHAWGLPGFDHRKGLFQTVLLQIKFKTQRGKMGCPRLHRDAEAHPRFAPRNSWVLLVLCSSVCFIWFLIFESSPLWSTSIAWHCGKDTRMLGEGAGDLNANLASLLCALPQDTSLL